MERVSIVIPNWNGSKWLPTCLDSLRRQTFQDFKTYVVDNGSHDDSLDLLRTRFPEVAIVSYAENRGFAAGVNGGIRASSGEYVVALNNDTEADSHWLKEIVAAMDARPDIGFCASKLLDFKNRSIIDSVGDGYSRAGLSFKIGARQRDDGRFAEPFEVFGACAAASMYRRRVLDEIGLFDEDFFAYMEDVDLSIRARLAGYGCICVPGAIVYHIGSATSGGTASAFSIRHTIKNIINILVKDIPAPMLPVMIVATAATQIGLLCQSLFTRKYLWLRRNLGAYFSGIAAAVRQGPTMLRKRREVRKLRRIGAAEFSRLISDATALRRAATRTEK